MKKIFLIMLFSVCAYVSLLVLPASWGGAALFVGSVLGLLLTLTV